MTKKSTKIQTDLFFGGGGGAHTDCLVFLFVCLVCCFFFFTTEKFVYYLVSLFLSASSRPDSSRDRKWKYQNLTREAILMGLYFRPGQN